MAVPRWHVARHHHTIASSDAVTLWPAQSTGHEKQACRAVEGDGVRKAEKLGLGDGCCAAGNHGLKLILDGGVPLNLCALILAPSERLLSPCKIRVQRTAGTNVALQRPRTATFNNESAPPCHHACAAMHARKQCLTAATTTPCLPIQACPVIGCPGLGTRSTWSSILIHSLVGNELCSYSSPGGFFLLFRTIEMLSIVLLHLF